MLEKTLKKFQIVIFRTFTAHHITRTNSRKTHSKSHRSIELYSFSDFWDFEDSSDVVWRLKPFRVSKFRENVGLYKMILESGGVTEGRELSDLTSNCIMARSADSFSSSVFCSRTSAEVLDAWLLSCTILVDSL